jgi:hemerythrin-like domain-containing protein
MKSTQFLMEEHKLILCALDVLDEMSAAAEVRKTGERDIDTINNGQSQSRLFDCHFVVWLEE